MKIRNGFVSNSSSSSFIVLSKKGSPEKPEMFGLDSLEVPGKFGGITEFDWSTFWSNDIGTKLNFLILQAQEYANDPYIEEENRDPTKLNLILDTLKEYLKVDEINIHFTKDFDWDEDEREDPEDVWAMIDHQSLFSQGTPIPEGLFTKEGILNFIFNPESKLLMGNDNDEDFYYEREKYEKENKE